MKRLHLALPCAVAACIAASMVVSSCQSDQDQPSPSPSPGTQISQAKGLFLHHSTGGCVWNGDGTSTVPAALTERNQELGTDYDISETAYPNDPWPWDNYPADYYRLWVGTEGSTTVANIYNLESLCQNYDLIIWKHCYPVNQIGPDTGEVDPSSGNKTLENYKAAYRGIKEKMLSFPNTRFIVWTGAVQLEEHSSQEAGQRLKDFRDWVVDEWDEAGDNVFVFDFWQLETGGGLYLLPANANSGDDHPNAEFCATVAPRFAERICDVLQGRGDIDPITGD